MLPVHLDVRSINQAIEKNAFGGGGGVYCQEQDGSISRIIRAKSVGGQLVVRRLNDGHWISPVAAWKEW